MAQPPQRPGDELDGVPDPKGYPVIPILGNFAAALFTPIPESETFLDPPSSTDSGPTRLDSLQKRLEAMDAHAVTNRDNMLDLCARERERIKQEGRRQEALEQRTGQTQIPDTPRGLHPHQFGPMIANMEAEPLTEPGSLEVAKGINRPAFTNQSSRPIRERHAIQLLDFAGFAADQAEIREADVARQRAELEAEIKVEQAMEEQARTAK
ncbi:hypothetical protein ACHAPT_007933 [Fusarium lateritium]